MDTFCDCFALPKSVRKQISEAREYLPVLGSVSQPSVETGIEDERLTRCVAHRPKIPDGMAAKEWLRKVPNFTRERKLPDHVMRNGKRLAELQSVHRLLRLLIEDGICFVVKPFNVCACKKEK